MCSGLLCGSHKSLEAVKIRSLHVAQVHVSECECEHECVSVNVM